MGELGETLKMHNLKQEKGQKLEMLQMFIYYIIHSYLSKSCTVSSFLPFFDFITNGLQKELKLNYRSSAFGLQNSLQNVMGCISKRSMLPETNSSPLKIGHPKRKGR